MASRFLRGKGEEDCRCCKTADNLFILSFVIPLRPCGGQRFSYLGDCPQVVINREGACGWGAELLMSGFSSVCAHFSLKGHFTQITFPIVSDGLDFIR